MTTDFNCRVFGKQARSRGRMPEDRCSETEAKYAGVEESIRELRQDIKGRLNQIASGVK